MNDAVTPVPASHGVEPARDLVSLLTWRMATVADVTAATSIRLGGDQEQFAGSVKEVFETLSGSPFGHLHHPAMVFLREKPVALFVLREGEAMPLWAPPCVVTMHSFRVAADHQRQGVGRFAFQAAIEWVRVNRPLLSHLMLAVNARNHEAIAAYMSWGFEDTGETHFGPIGKQIIMRHPAAA